jgi:hypothetical protein
VRLGELIEGDHPIPVPVEPLTDRGHALLRAPSLERPLLVLGRLAALGMGDLDEQALGLGLQPTRQRVEDVQDPMILDFARGER